MQLEKPVPALGRPATQGEAVATAISAVSADPLRESAHRVLIEAHLAEGNVAEDRRAYGRYRAIARRELGIEPGQELTSLIRNGTPALYAGT